ncbi:MAG: class I SAM-dependent methyltransferase [Rhodospirillales bacterium]|nr:class I SAM-dependent methyltransferase [Rhodospirillales bacterium]
MAETAKQHHCHVCPWWLAYTFDNFLRRRSHPAEKTLAPYVRTGMRAADFGCGFGHFALGMARLVGDAGRVYAIDLQKQMLAKTMKRARKQGLSHVIEPVLCTQGQSLLPGNLDFVLASNVLHEVPDLPGLLSDIGVGLNQGGIFYVMEPSGHVKRDRLDQEIALTIHAGFEEIGRPRLAREHCVVFRKIALAEES